MIAQFNFVVEVWWQWMSSMIWQAGLLILLVTILDMAIRRWAWPQVRYVLWGLVFLKLVIPPTWEMPTSIVSWLQTGVENQISIQIETVEITDKAARTFDSAPPLQSRPTDSSVKKAPVWKTALFIAWFAGMAVYALTIIIRMVRLRKRSHAPGDSLPTWFHELLADTARRMKLKRIPAVVMNENATGPAVFGLFRPALLLPEGYLEKLSKQEATHVLLHELCHLKRGDLVLHWFSLLLQAAYWFNPLLLWARRQMRHTCEICCDLSVAGILREKTLAYRSTLLNSARELLSETVDSSLGFLGIFEDPFRLVSRLKWLEKNTWEHPGKKAAAVVFTLLAMVFCVMPMHGYSQPPATNESLPVQPNDTVVGGQMQTPDSPPVQYIYIETLILEVSDDADFDIGCPEKHERGASFATCDGVTIEGERYPDLETAIQGLSGLSGVRVLQQPRIMTFNNKTASVTIGRENEAPELLLEITPQLLEDGRMLQDIYLEATLTTGEAISTDQVEPPVWVQDGEILAIRIPASGAEATATDAGPLCCYVLVSSHALTGSESIDDFLPRGL